MKNAKFKIGDRVKAVGYKGIEGEIVDVMNSMTSGWRYEVEDKNGSQFFLCEDALELARKDYSMEIKIDIANNVLIATLYESTGGAQKPVAKGHGHLIHEGELGIAQAASYACNRLWKRVAGVE
jgi:hypothetical protein